MGLVAALRFVEGLYRGAILGLQRQGWLNVVSSILATIRGPGAVGVLAWVVPTIWAFLSSRTRYLDNGLSLFNLGPI